MVIYGGLGADSLVHYTNFACDVAGSCVGTIFTAGHSDWWQLPTANDPAWRQDHKAIYDPYHDRMVVFGGAVKSGYSTIPTNETWVLNFTNCVQTVGAVSDLEVKTVGSHHVYLRWTVPCGPACSYDIRYSTSEIDDTNFASATQFVTGLVPLPAGTRDSVDVTGLSNGTQYYLALKSSSSCGYSSAVSNDACAIPGNPGFVCYPESRYERDPGTAPAPVGARLAFGRVQPNPSRGMFTVNFSLPDAHPASIDVMDIAGRRIRSMDVGQMGAGMHSVDFGADRTLAPGYYVLRLRHDDKVLTSGAIVLH